MRCGNCDQDMAPGVSCVWKYFLSDDGGLEPIVYGKEERYGTVPVAKYCHDCLTPIGGTHHNGCDQESCPQCHNQLISCGCWMAEDQEFMEYSNVAGNA